MFGAGDLLSGIPRHNQTAELTDDGMTWSSLEAFLAAKKPSQPEGSMHGRHPDASLKMPKQQDSLLIVENVTRPKLSLGNNPWRLDGESEMVLQQPSSLKHTSPSGGKASKQLRHAAQINDLPSAKDCVRRLGVDVNGKDGSGRTALFHAVGNGAVDVVEYLLSQSANPNILDIHDSGPVDEAQYWLSKCRLRDVRDPEGDLPARLEKVLDLLFEHGGTAQPPDQLNNSEFDRRKRMQCRANELGIILAWTAPEQYALPLPPREPILALPPPQYQ